MGKLVKLALFVVAFGIALGLLPFTIGGLLGWLIFKKVANNRVKYGLLTVVAILILFFGSAWVAALNSSSKQPITPTKTIPTFSPSPTSTPVPTDVPKKELYKVTKVIDGDTINVEIN